MKIIFPKTAFTLIELIVSMALVSVIVLGIFSITSVLSGNNIDYGQRYLVMSSTQTTLNHILNNASLAIGSGTLVNGSPDKGILIGGPCGGGSCGDLGNDDTVNNPYTFCIHQDIPVNSTTANSPPTTPPYDNTSRWLCYTFYTNDQIFYCQWPYNPGAQPWGATSCAKNPNPQYLGTALNITNPTTGNGPSFSVSPGGSMIFSIGIQNCLDDSQSTSQCNTPNNPQATVSGSISPSQVGTG